MQISIGRFRKHRCLHVRWIEKSGKRYHRRKSIVRLSSGLLPAIRGGPRWSAVVRGRRPSSVVEENRRLVPNVNLIGRLPGAAAPAAPAAPAAARPSLAPACTSEAYGSVRAGRQPPPVTSRHQPLSHHVTGKDGEGEKCRQVGTKMAVLGYEREDELSRGSRFPLFETHHSSLSSRVDRSVVSNGLRYQVDNTEAPQSDRPVELREQLNLLRKWLNKTKVYNKHIIARALDLRPKHVPLITVSNHHSCFDDPGIWATLDLRHMLNRRAMRWSLTAHDICFTNVWHSYFFMLGKCIPVVRGNGVYQEAIDFCIEKLASGEWVHVFPEGKVNMLKEDMRLKWGVGRLILESPVTPLVIPICHLGMDQILPNEPPYLLRTGKKVTLLYGEPIDLSELLAELREAKASEVEARKAITDRIQEELLRLKAATELIHQKL